MSPIDIQLVEHLHAAGLPTLIAGQVTAVVSFLAFGGGAGGVAVIAWIIAFSLLTAFRLWRLGTWRGRLPWNGLQARLAANEYRLLTLLSGLAWSYPLLVLNYPIGSIQQIYTLVITIGMPVAAMPANSIHLPVYRCFLIPMIAVLLYWSVSVPPGLNAEFSFVSIVYGVILYITAHSYYQSQRGNIEAREEKQRLIDDLSRAKSRLEEIAYLDPLTGLANRRWFQSEAERLLERNRAKQQRAALLLIDMDDFKHINDTFGHAAGDRLLMSIADRLNRALRLTDVAMHKTAEISRYGGDEFMALLIDADGEEGTRKAVSRIMRMIAQPLSMNGVEVIPSVSIGVAMAPDDGEELDVLIRKADIAMYRAKQSGRNRFVFHGELEETESDIRTSI